MLKVLDPHPRLRGIQPHPSPPAHHPVGDSRVSLAWPAAPHQQRNSQRAAAGMPLTAIGGAALLSSSGPAVLPPGRACRLQTVAAGPFSVEAMTTAQPKAAQNAGGEHRPSPQ